jgi:hypothetical protein
LIRSFEEKFAVEVVVEGRGEERTRGADTTDADGTNATGEDNGLLCSGAAEERDTATAVEAFDTMRRSTPKVCLSYFEADLDANLGKSISTSTSETKGLELNMSVDLLPEPVFPGGIL